MCRNFAVCFLFLTCFLISLTTPAQDSSQSPERHEGTAPRASAEKYHSHAQKDGFSLGAPNSSLRKKPPAGLPQT
jgi:hypothetical protein